MRKRHTDNPHPRLNKHITQLRKKNNKRRTKQKPEKQTTSCVSLLCKLFSDKHTKIHGLYMASEVLFVWKVSALSPPEPNTECQSWNRPTSYFGEAMLNSQDAVCSLGDLCDCSSDLLYMLWSSFALQTLLLLAPTDGFSPPLVYFLNLFTPQEALMFRNPTFCKCRLCFILFN